MNAQQRRIDARQKKAAHPFRNATKVRVVSEQLQWSGRGFPLTSDADGNDKKIKVGMVLEIQSKKWVPDVGDYALTFKDIYTLGMCDETVPLATLSAVQECYEPI